MITEDYVSFEAAKLLKEKGFDKDCFRYAENKEIYESGDWSVANVTGGCIGVPTLQTAMKWLRDEHKAYIMIDRSFSMEDSWHYCICVNDDFDNLIQQETQPHRKYEEFCEAAIKYCLKNLI